MALLKREGSHMLNGSPTSMNTANNIIEESSCSTRSPDTPDAQCVGAAQRNARDMLGRSSGRAILRAEYKLGAEYHKLGV